MQAEGSSLFYRWLGLGLAPVIVAARFGLFGINPNVHLKTDIHKHIQINDYLILTRVSYDGFKGWYLRPTCILVDRHAAVEHYG